MPIPMRFRACSKGLKVPRLGLIGPWAHIYPQDGEPGPAIGFLQEAMRWWDHWLKGEDRGIMAEPMLRAFIEEWTPPGASRPGAGPIRRRRRMAVACASASRFSSDRARSRRAPSRRHGRDSIRSPCWTGCGGRRMDGHGRCRTRSRPTSATTTASRASSTARRSPSASRSSARRSIADRTRLRQARGAALRPAVRRRARRFVTPGLLRRAQSHPSRQPCRAERAGAGRILHASRLKLNDCGYAFAARPCDAAGAFERLLAADLAGARGRDVDAASAGPAPLPVRAAERRR